MEKVNLNVGWKSNHPQSLREFKKVLSWKGAFWITSGAATAGLFGIGAVVSLDGTAAIPIIVISSLIGFVQLFLYAELAGLFPNKTGGGSIYGSVGWKRFGKLFIPINVGSYWYGISTSLTVFASLAGSYVISAFFANSAFATFSVTLVDLSSVLPGIKLQINGSIVVGALVLIGVFLVQHSGILRAARSQMILGLMALIPLVVLIVSPFLAGKINIHNFLPVALPGDVSWKSWQGVSLIAAGLYVTGWATYGCEQAVAYIAEFTSPREDGIRALVSSGALGFVLFVGLPLALLGTLGLAVVTSNDFVNGYTQDAFLKLVETTFGTASSLAIAVALIASIILAMGTIMASSSRTLYQGAIDGIFPRSLGFLNVHGVPSRGMWVDLLINLVLLLLGNPLFILAAGNVAYLLCVAMDVSAVRLLRSQYPTLDRPYRAPDWLANYGGPVLGAFNVLLILLGANTSAANSLWYGGGVILIIVLVFSYRHYVTDRGIFPEALTEDLTPSGVR